MAAHILMMLLVLEVYKTAKAGLVHTRGDRYKVYLQMTTAKPLRVLIAGRSPL
jgi:hypothetical protein